MNLAVSDKSTSELLYGRSTFLKQSAELSAIGIGQPGLVMPAFMAETRSGSNQSLWICLLELDREKRKRSLAIEIKRSRSSMNAGDVLTFHLGLKFIGLLGALVEGKRRGYVAAVKPILDDLMAQAGFWVSGYLYARVLREVGE
jgi:hypothetical protein